VKITLDIDVDLLRVAEELAELEGSTIEKVVSALVQRGLAAQSYTTRNGVPVLPSRGEVVTIEHVQNLMD